MFCVVYRFDVHEGREDEFVEVWTLLTERILAHQGSLGSRLHRDRAGAFIAYAQWPTRTRWESTMPLPGDGPSLMTRLRGCCAVTVLHELEVQVDRLVPAAGA